MIIPKYYEDLETLHVNTMPNRAYYIPASGRMENPVRDREASDRFVLLSGEWKFRYFDSIYDVREEFFRENYDCSEFESVKVPGVWQNYGHDRHQYTNVRYPFPMDPPYVPHENPCGEYVCAFDYHRDEKAPRVYLNFEGVDSCFYVWLNGCFVGYSQVSHSTSEFEITDKLREGENRLCVLVLKWCDGSYLEDQDKFRMSGIFRDVYLLKRPEEGIFDYFVKAKPAQDYRDGRVEITVWYQGKPVSTRASLFDPQGKLAAEGGADFLDGKGQITLEVKDAYLWNAEEPWLYTLTLETEDEVITDLVGIREIHAEDGVLYINGVKVKFHGTNRHDSDPLTGFVISPEQLMVDLTLMKQHNINAIRTSHYPNAPWAYQLYDRIGFYVIDEADNESHGAESVYSTETDWASRSRRWGVAIADNPDFTKATVDRTRRCVERDKNRPCVVMWSMGNECAYGCTFEAALKWTKEFDPDRLTHYESARYVPGDREYDYSALDTYSCMYPSLESLHEYFEKGGAKPYVMCEYCHAMGNGPGDLEDYFQAVQQYDGACGGFIWEWCDHAIYMGTNAVGKKMYGYGGDHGEFPHDDNFCMDGLVYPDRRVHTGLKEFKNVHRPARIVSLDQEKKEIVLHNYMDFVNLKDYVTVRYEVICDGLIKETGVVDSQELLDIPAHQERAVPVSFTVPESGKCFLKVTYIQKTAGQILPAGFELGFEEAELKNADGRNQRVKELLVDGNVHSGIEICEDDRRITLSAEEFCYTYDKLSGVFSEMVHQNQSLLERSMEYNIWRAPTDNDRNIKREWTEAGYNRTVARAYETRVWEDDGRVKIETVLSLSAVYLQRILDIRACWTIWPDGRLDVELHARKNPVFPFLPRFGLRLFLPGSMTKVTYCGLGPAESYIDKRRSSWHGLFETDVKAMHEDYLRPQENGSHHDCDYVTVRGERAALTAAGEETFAFNASVYTQEELTEKMHNYELEASPYTVLCLDYRHSGIGSASCGPMLRKEYRLDGEEMNFSVRLIPERV